MIEPARLSVCVIITGLLQVSDKLLIVFNSVKIRLMFFLKNDSCIITVFSNFKPLYNLVSITDYWVFKQTSPSADWNDTVLPESDSVKLKSALLRWWCGLPIMSTPFMFIRRWNVFVVVRDHLQQQFFSGGDVSTSAPSNPLCMPEKLISACAPEILTRNLPADPGIEPRLLR